MSQFINKLKLHLAKKRDARCVTRLFSLTGSKICRKKILELIKKRKIFVLKKKGKITAAFSYTIFSIIGFFTIMYIHKLAVAPEFQGKGIGTFLLSRLRLTSIKIGATALFLYSAKKAKRFYEKNNLNGLWRFFWWRKA